MKPINGLILLVFTTLIVACRPKTGGENTVPNPPPKTFTADSVYFKHHSFNNDYYGMYRITANDLTEDSSARRGAPEKFIYKLSDSVHKEVVSILSNIPQEMQLIDGSILQDLSNPQPETIEMGAFIGDELLTFTFWGIPKNMPEGTQAYVERIKQVHNTLKSTR